MQRVNPAATVVVVVLAVLAARQVGPAVIGALGKVVAKLSASESEKAPKDPARRPRKWAVPLEKPGVKNLHKVSKGLYRGAQPTEAGFAELEKMGVKTILNLRSFHNDREALEGTRLAYEQIRMQAWSAEDEEIVRFLKIATDREKVPVFVHCLHGADRTGTMVAVYRIAVEGWTKNAAIREMTQGGHGYHTVWKNLVDHIEGLDVEKLKKQAGLTGATKR